jgi:hypothetical protein
MKTKKVKNEGGISMNKVTKRQLENISNGGGAAHNP